MTYAEFDRAVSAFASRLRDLGCQQGDRVALVMPNRAEYLVALLGAFRGGFVAVPVNVKLHALEVRYILEHSDARVAVFSETTRSTMREATQTLDGVHPIDVDTAHGAQAFVTAEHAHDGSLLDADVDPDSPAWIFYTSGTTGRPKGAVLSHRNLAACTVGCLADMIDFRPDDVALHVAPLSHGSGLYSLPAIARGAKSLIYSGSSFDADDVLRTMVREKVTVIPFLAPTMIHRMVEADSGLAVPSFRRAVYGGAPIDMQLAEAAIERFGQVFVQLYGQGEAPMTITRLSPEDHRGDLLCSAGTVRTNVEVKLVDSDGVAVPDGEEGEVCVRGDVVMCGYLDDPDANAQALRDGWLHTGDVGRLEDGYLYLLSRQKDVIISGGSNIYPREVEDALLRHPSVHEVCVYGEPDLSWGESVVAVVVVKAPVTAVELQEFCKGAIASFKKPKRIEFVDELPRNAYGKVSRRDVRAAVEASAATT